MKVWKGRLYMIECGYKQVYSDEQVGACRSEHQGTLGCVIRFTPSLLLWWCLFAAYDHDVIVCSRKLAPAEHYRVDNSSILGGNGDFNQIKLSSLSSLQLPRAYQTVWRQVKPMLMHHIVNRFVSNIIYIPVYIVVQFSTMIIMSCITIIYAAASLSPPWVVSFVKCM